MTESVYVNSDRSKVVEAGSPEAAYKVHVKEAKRLGLIKEPPKGTKVVEPSDPEQNGDKPKRTYRRATKNE